MKFPSVVVVGSSLPKKKARLHLPISYVDVGLDKHHSYPPPKSLFKKHEGVLVLVCMKFPQFFPKKVQP